MADIGKVNLVEGEKKVSILNNSELTDKTHSVIVTESGNKSDEDNNSKSIVKKTKKSSITPKIKLPNRFAIYASANFVNMVLKKLNEIKLALLLSSKIKETHKIHIQRKISQLNDVLDEE